MEFGRIEYFTKNGSHRRVILTLVGQSDDEVLKREGLRGLRLRRILRLTNEAQEQGVLLSYGDLSALLLTSISTLKRDIAYLERQGYTVPFKRKRKNKFKGQKTQDKKLPENVVQL